jgi:hypothetical protein
MGISTFKPSGEGHGQPVMTGETSHPLEHGCPAILVQAESVDA